MIFGVVDAKEQTAVPREKFEAAFCESVNNDDGKRSIVFPDPSVALAYSPVIRTDVYQCLEPVVSDSGDTALVFSGQIYNLDALSRMFGVAFTNGGNIARFVLDLYTTHGLTFLNKINGKFFFGIWEKRIEGFCLFGIDSELNRHSGLRQMRA